MNGFTRPLLASVFATVMTLAPATAWAGSIGETSDDGPGVPSTAQAVEPAGPLVSEPAPTTPPADPMVDTPVTQPPTEPTVAPSSAPPAGPTTPQQAQSVADAAGTGTTEPSTHDTAAPGPSPDLTVGRGVRQGDDDGGTLPEGVVVTVDGRDITASDPGGSLPKIASCTIDVSASGLTTDPPDTIGVRVVAWPPTASEEDRPVLVDVTEVSDAGMWAGSFAMDELVQQFDRSPNGYHLRFEFLVNGIKGAMKMYWLGCGEPQTGNPRRMLFDVEWTTHDGTPLTGRLDKSLPPGWRQQLRLAATGDRGTVGCRYPAGSDALTCTYDNPGHGDQPGLVLPGEPGTSYRVTVVGVPDGWVVDSSTVGVFLADDTCPKGTATGPSGRTTDPASRACTRSRSQPRSMTKEAEDLVGRPIPASRTRRAIRIPPSRLMSPRWRALGQPNPARSPRRGSTDGR